MPLVNLKPVLREAKAKGYAVAAFNPVDYASMKAMVKAAEELNAPGHHSKLRENHQVLRPQGHHRLDARDRRRFAGARRAAPRPRQRRRHDQEVRRNGLDVGHDRLVRQAVRHEPRARRARSSTWRPKPDIGVEAEIGEIHGVEDDMVVESVHYTDPARSREVLPRARSRRVRRRDRHRARLLQGRAGREIRLDRRDQPPHEHADGAARRHGPVRRDHPEVHQARLREDQHLHELEARVHRQLHRLPQEEQQIRAAERARRRNTRR